MSSLFVDPAISVIEIDEVFVARIVSGEHILSNCENIFTLTFMFSVTASITRSDDFALFISVEVERLPNVAVF